MLQQLGEMASQHGFEGFVLFVIVVCFWTWKKKREKPDAKVRLDIEDGRITTGKVWISRN